MTRYSELVFYAQTVILLKSRSRIETDMNDIKVQIRTDMNDRPYITHGEVSEVRYFCSQTYSSKKNLNSDVGSDWLNWCIRPSDWLAEI